nr:retrotransposon protein, putative, Ty1-copia subclass [Tanacetum cinerariifolium]
MLQSVKSYLGRCFAKKDLGEAAYILGIKIYRDRSSRLIGLCQSAYMKKILKQSCMENSKRESIPMQEKLKLNKSQGASTPAELKRMQNVPYASAVGSIMYAVRCTRPDVANTKDIFLVYGGDLKQELRVSCYTDAGYLTDADDLKSQTGYVFILNGGVVDWKSTKQSIFATLFAEAEYIATFDASNEAPRWENNSRKLGADPDSLILRTLEEELSLVFSRVAEEEKERSFRSWWFSAIPRDGIFKIDLSNSHTNESSIYDVSNKRAKLDLDYALLWHCRLGHISKKRIEKLQHDGLFDSTDIRAFETCMSGKMARKPYTHQMERAKDLLGLIHTDVCGPFKIMSRQGASYFVTFTDDFSCYGYVYLLKPKHEVFETFKVFQKEVENQLAKTIKSLRLDRGGEYMSQEFLDHLKDHGIIAHRTPPYTSQHNGYPKETIGYSFYYPPENKVLVARNAEFPKNSLINQEASGSLEDLKIIQEEDTHPSIDTSLNHKEDDLEIDEPQSDIIPIRRFTRTRHAPDRMCLYIDAEEHELGDLGEPVNYKAVLLDLKSKKWLNAINVKMQSMKDNEVWVLVELPPNGKTVGSKWLFKCFAMKDLGEAAYILGIKIYRDRSSQLIGLCQSAYMKKILKQFCMKNSKRESIPMQEKLKLNKSQGASTPAELKRMQNVPYASAVGSIMYAVRCTRPDVAFAQNVTSQFQQNPSDLHWTTVKNILKYLRNTKDIFLVYEGDLKQELRVSCYTDAGYMTDADDLKSQTGYVFILNGGVVDWKSAKQSIFATLFAEAEYIAAFDAFNEAV